MSDEDIDLDRVIVDPEYRRKVIAFLNAAGPQPQPHGPSAADEMPAPAGATPLGTD